MREKSLYVLGLTGSIGAGKSETARMFRRLGFLVSASDDIVRALYERGEVEEELAALFPEISSPFSPSKVAIFVMRFPERLKALEKLLHPFVQKAHHQHIQEAQQKGERLMILDIPLLFEVGWDKACDGVLVVTCEPTLQKQRVMRRPDMTEEKFNFLYAQQWSQEKKRARADFVLDTTKGRRHTLRALGHLLQIKC